MAAVALLVVDLRVAAAFAARQTCCDASRSLGDQLGRGWTRHVQLWRRGDPRRTPHHLAPNRHSRHLRQSLAGGHGRRIARPSLIGSRARKGRTSRDIFVPFVLTRSPIEHDASERFPPAGPQRVYGTEMQQPTEEVAVEIPACVHHWVLGSPVGGSTSGRCRDCGEERDFQETYRPGAFLSRHRRK